MKSFKELTHLGQVRRLRETAKAALLEFGLTGCQPRYIHHGENTTYRVTLSDSSEALLRLHRPGYQTEEFIASELMWLEALARDGFDVQVPRKALDGRRIIEVSSPGLRPRLCTLLSWLPGRFVHKNLGLGHARAVGRLTARLHEQATAWRRPARFNRRRWDPRSLFYLRDEGPIEDIWKPFDKDQRKIFDKAVKETVDLYTALDRDPKNFTLIHADIHFANVLFDKGQAKPIDFDDCALAPPLLDLAVTTIGFTRKANYKKLRKAYFEGYEELRGSAVDEEMVDLLMAARNVTLVLWVSERALESVRFKDMLPRYSKAVIADLKKRY